MAGIVGDKRDLNRRRLKFGANLKMLKQPASIVESFKQAAMDTTWLVIAISAIVSGVMGWIVVGYGGLIEGIAIILTGLLIICVTTLADYL